MVVLLPVALGALAGAEIACNGRYAEWNRKVPGVLADVE